MKHIFKYILLTGSFLITACVSDRYQPASLSEELSGVSRTVQGLRFDDQWWKGYENAELDRLVTLALQRNPDYLKAAVAIERALAELSLNTSNLFPTLEASLGASTQSAVRRTSNFSSNFSAEFGLNYEVDLYGKIRQQYDAQLFEARATVEDRHAAYLSLVNSVTDLYFNLTYLQNAMTLAQKNIEAYEGIYKIAEQKYKAGRADGVEALEAKQSILTEQNRLLQLETQFREMESSLKNILNIRPEESFSVAYGNLTDQKNIRVDLDVPVSVLAERPDLKAAQYRLEKAFKSLQAEEKNWYPNVSISGAVQSSSDKARTTFDFPFLVGRVGLDLPFLDWNRVRQNVRIAKADYETTAIGFSDTLTQALNEIAYYDFAYEQSFKTYQNVEENYNNAVRITAYYQQRYSLGKVEFRYYLEALNRENSLREDLIAQKYQMIKYENYIFKAMGGRYTKK